MLSKQFPNKEIFILILLAIPNLSFGAKTEISISYSSTASIRLYYSISDPAKPSFPEYQRFILPSSQETRKIRLEIDTLVTSLKFIYNSNQAGRLRINSAEVTHAGGKIFIFRI
jgi:hypothetical protein